MTFPVSPPPSPLPALSIFCFLHRPNLCHSHCPNPLCPVTLFIPFPPLLATPFTLLQVSLTETNLLTVRGLLQVDFQKKEGELFEPHSLPPWFTWDTKLGSLTLHLECPQVFAAEGYPKTLGLQVLVGCMAPTAASNCSKNAPVNCAVSYPSLAWQECIRTVPVIAVWSLLTK